MKKNLIILLIFMMFIPFVVNAKEYCTVVSGNGKDIGSEIACGKEHFYVVDTTDDSIRMLAKYNLYVGENYDKIVLDIDTTYMKVSCEEYIGNQIEYNCSYYNTGSEFYFEGEQVSSYNEWMSKLMDKYNFDRNQIVTSNIEKDGYIIEGDKRFKISTYKIYPYTTIEPDTEGYALQNELALGVTGEKGNANYPIYSTLKLLPGISNEIHNFDTFEEGYTNFDFKDSNFIKTYLNDYNSNLNDMGYDVLEVNMLNIKEVNDLIYKISNKNLPLAQWYNLSLEAPEIEEEALSKYKKLGDLKEFVSDDYKWIWNTSYWTKTIVDELSHTAYFVSSAGEICYSDACLYSVPRAGIRPVVTISKDSIKYAIKTKTDGNGTIEVVDSAFGGEAITFRVSARKGLRLAGLSITTDKDEIVQFNEEDLTTNSDGTISIRTNKFTMPYESVMIEAKWNSNIINPKTGPGMSIFITLFVLLVSTIAYMVLRRRNAYILR